MNPATVVIALLCFFAFIGWGMHTEMERRVQLVQQNRDLRVRVIIYQMRIQYTCFKHPKLNICGTPSEETEGDPPK